ncbi:hypothetical protein [Clostridioides sp. ZZV15-6383]
MAFIECKFKSKYTGGETDVIVVLPVANGKELFIGKELYFLYQIREKITL